MIDSRTGLPIAGLSAPPELAAWQADYVRGFNEEMLRAVGSGQVTTDFRPLLMTREQIHEAFRDHTLGTLSPDCPRLEDAGGRFILKLDVPKPRKASKTGLPRPARPPSVLISRPGGEPDKRLLYCEEPVDAALGQDGRVVLIKTCSHYLAYDEETTQILHRYPVR
jgi:hypothetical protein